MKWEQGAEFLDRMTKSYEGKVVQGVMLIPFSMNDEVGMRCLAIQFTDGSTINTNVEQVQGAVNPEGTTWEWLSRDAALLRSQVMHDGV